MLQHCSVLCIYMYEQCIHIILVDIVMIEESYLKLTYKLSEVNVRGLIPL